ncbi:MAG: UDP-N-acetylmuramoyl-L-alanyl-D-glutamate--2,6-diaminopimelate ligase [Bacteroidales bacterium]|nr:UDP-N-acetylmuramoyl-L-alanyl-D-glutamate--2,6-diaminopimelate ligase [Bacteroidales bacterium]MDG2082069.1 UDP-N-acetylmuramoyl-L-alanyl-D-glutamate--2,6-diaminopimelate ligase [Bacteroidales bacterium]
MKKLQDILYRSGITEINGSIDINISTIEFDSRKVIKGSLFIAVKGTQVDGHDFIEMAISNGAIAVVCNELPMNINEAVTYAVSKNSAKALGFISANFYDNPTEKIQLVGITGTNGKTTIATLLYQLFKDLGYGVGLISTIHNVINDTILESTHTTPDSISLNSLLAKMVDAGCEYAFMEVSSHAVAQQRISGIRFSGGLFTNITHEHLDYHGSFKAYINAKKYFFDSLSADAFSLTNSDDKNGSVMLQNTKSSKYTYGIKSIAKFKGKIIENGFEGMMLKIDGEDVYSLIPGNFNAYNLLAVYATAMLLNQEKNEVLISLSKLKGAEGRFDLIKSQTGIIAIIDYAHTPDALENVLKTINSIRTQNEELITVVGAGGNRDKTKRPIMANVASLLSTRVILTSDNPRNEDPKDILNDMKIGIDPAKKNTTMMITDRKEAIRTAFNIARPGDIILIAGKGHEKYQEISGIRYPFDDKQVITELMENN